MTLALNPSDLTPGDVAWLRGQYDPWLWASVSARIKLPKSLSGMELTSRPFLRDLYRDMWPEIIVMKGAQMGMSTCAIIRTCWFLTTFPSTVIYTWPTSSDVGRFTQGRINPLIRSSQFLLDRIIDVDSVMQKQFRVIGQAELEQLGRQHGRKAVEGPRSVVYFTGSASEKDAISIDADLLVHDEEDLADPKIIEQFAHRLDASRFGWKFRLSTPRLPGAGIDRVFVETDKRHWLVRCSGCNAQFEMAFPGGPWGYSNIEPDPNDWGELDWLRWEEEGKPARFVCHRCGKTLTNDERNGGRWVAESRDRGRAHGYAISQMAAGWKTAANIVEAFRAATWRTDFWNLTMGIPWQEGTSLLTETAIRERADPQRPMESTGSGTTMGIDVGARFHVVIGKSEGGVPRTIWMGAVASFEECDALMIRYGVASCVIDAAPEEHATRKWADKYNRYAEGSQMSQIRVWRCVYAGGGRPGYTAQLRWNESNGIVEAPRTEILSTSAEELLTRRVLPRYDGSNGWKEYVAHHVASKKVPIWVKGLEVQRILDKYEWHEVGADHLFHAATYEMIARQAPRGAGGARVGLVTTKRGRTAHEVDRPLNIERYRQG
jgi:Phage terminase large subunit (GpA)